MELVLGLLGLGGLSLLMQAKPLPTQKEADKALEKLAKSPDDAQANQTVGMYVAFVVGNYTEALPYLAKSSNTTLKKLAELEAVVADDPPEQVKLGNEWIQAAPKFPALVPIFYDRASFWYMKAWPKLSDPDKAKMRLQAQKLAAPRRPGPARKNLPSSWEQDNQNPVKPSEIDHTIARTGSYSIKINPSNPSVPTGFSGIQSVPYAVKGTNYEAVAFFRSVDTESQRDLLALTFYDDRGSVITHAKKAIPVDNPFWTPVVLSGEIPKGASEVRLVIHIYSKEGNVWVDDVSLKFNSINDMKNGSFEEK